MVSELWLGWLGCTYPEIFISWFDPSVTLMCFHTSNSESSNWWKLHKHIFFGSLSKCVVCNPSQRQYIYIWILLSASSFPSGSYSKALWHTLNLLLYVLFSDENLNKTALNCQTLLLLISLSIFTFVLSRPSGSCPPPLFFASTLIAAQPEPVKPYLLYRFHSCSVLVSLFCWFTSSSLFHTKMLASLG